MLISMLLFLQKIFHSYFLCLNLVPKSEVCHFVIHTLLDKFGPKDVLPINWNVAFVNIINIYVDSLTKKQT